jgi:5-hydroxyisourate hydrolase
MSTITTHVLDTARGRPAAGVPVRLEVRGEGGSWREVGEGVTDADGRIAEFVPPNRKLQRAVYRLTFDTSIYYAAQGERGFYTEVAVTFFVVEAGAHYHVPLLLSPYGYTTYRGS